MVSVIIPTFNKADYLDLTLASFTLQDFTDFELVIINDGSADHTDAIIKKYCNRLNITSINQDNRGRSAARNAGIACSEGEIIIFNDDDRMVHPQFVSGHVKELCKAEDIAIMGWRRGVLTIWKKNRLRLNKQIFNLFLANNPYLIEKLNTIDTLQLVSSEDVERDFYNILHTYSIHEPDSSDNYQQRLVDIFSDDLTDFCLAWTIGTTANMSVRSAVIKELHGFDEDYIGWGMEDTDLSYRLYRAGIKFRSRRTAMNFHQIHPLGASTAHHDLRQRDFQWYQNLMRFCEKYSTLDTFVFWEICKRKELDFISANTLLQKLRSTDDCVLNELLRMYRELFALTKQIKDNEYTAV